MMPVTVMAKARIALRLARARLPEPLMVRLLPEAERFSSADVPEPITAPEGSTRLLIGPANFAAQGYAWARAAERLPDVGAKNMQYRGAADYGFPADYSVPERVWTHSRRWGLKQRDAVGAGFTHTLFEAERSLFGAAEDKHIVREGAWLRDHGVTIGAICHGTDIRRPSRHRQVDAHSPFHDADPDWIAFLERRATRNLLLLDELDAPVFVSTPEMLLDRPGATWLPVVVEPARWSNTTAVLERRVPVVLHAPTNPLFKGTQRIEPVVESLAEQGVIDYRRVVKVPAEQMPGLYADADIVLEQFALGMYSVTAVEAMAAGRLVLAHVHDQVREHVRSVTGMDVPVVSATPETLRDVLLDIRDRPDHYQRIAARGPAFVAAAHDGRLSAHALAPFLGVGA